MKYLAPWLVILGLLSCRPTETKHHDKPYVCTPEQAEAAECLPILKSPT